MACSTDSTEGFCPSIDSTCQPLNVCRTCNTFTDLGGKCVEIDRFPNATISEYGMIFDDIHAIMSEIYVRGPVAATVNAEPLITYEGGVFNDTLASRETNHVVSIVGWGSVENQNYWIVRNSWGEYWGEMGFFRVLMGQNVLGLEGEIAWATPGRWTEVNFPCDEDGKNCQIDRNHVEFYRDPSLDLTAVKRRLLRGV